MATTGVKRHAPDDLDRDQRLAKRFDLLNIHHGGKLYIPVSSTSSALTSTPATRPQASRRKRSNTPRDVSDQMQVEDTPHRVYVHDLSAELEDASSDEEHPIFLPDIEKHLLKIPRHVLIDDHARKAQEDMQLVLYTEPKSLTVSGDDDGVRRLIRESRQRAREMRPFTIPDAPSVEQSTTGKSGGSLISEDDPDAMDLG